TSNASTQNVTESEHSEPDQSQQKHSVEPGTNVQPSVSFHSVIEPEVYVIAPPNNFFKSIAEGSCSPTNTKSKSHSHDGHESTPYVTCGAVLGTHSNRRLSKHENSGPHKDSVHRYTQSKQNVNVFKLIVDKAENVKQENISRNRRIIQKLFKTCVFVAKKNWAQMNISDLLTFMGETCDPEINAIVKNESVTYLSSTSISEILTILSDYIERKVFVELRGEKFTLLADESTDRSNRTQFFVFARYVKNADPVEQYSGLIHKQLVWH
ncbi:hypothetical protein MAR_011331, partial [Mya arenaria]